MHFYSFDIYCNWFVSLIKTVSQELFRSFKCILLINVALRHGNTYLSKEKNLIDFWKKIFLLAK